MRDIFSPNEYSIMTTLIRSNQKTTKKMLDSLLNKYYPNMVIRGEKSLIARGEIPIALIAHMDTVFEQQNFSAKEIFYDRQQNVMWSPQNAGFDDKAGIFAILRIIQDGFRPWVIFTCDEETGGAGAREVAARPTLFKEIKYFIQLDRQGKTDCVFYDCDNKDFVKYVSSFGFIEDWGTFSDISIICPTVKTAGVNLSVGYRDEHTREEILYVSALKSTIRKVEKMLGEIDIPYFEYVPYHYRGFPYAYNLYSGCTCCKCGKNFYDYEIYPVNGLDGQIKIYCPDCISTSNIDWCNYCDEPFEQTDEDIQLGFQGVCRDCRKDLVNDASKSGRARIKILTSDTNTAQN